MADNKRPQSHKKNVAGGGSGTHKRGSGFGSGPVGSSSVGRGRGNEGRRGPSRAAIGGGLSLPVIIIMAIYFLFGGGGGGGTTTTTQPQGTTGGTTSSQTSDYTVYYPDSTTATAPASNYSNEATTDSQTDETVAAGSREKRTKILGGGKDTVTLMVYMCGTDLESRSGMASSDLQEMANANIADNVNIIVYTGGCRSWRINGISNSKNQIYQVVHGNLKRLVDNDGAKVMTDPATLSSFIQWTAKNYPANRYDLILWDHGGGSVSGYGYDEKASRSGSMDLAGISRALKDGGVSFDFVGFDACLMATAETALMLDDYADYMIASEETEPGIGWYYTNWVSSLSANTSVPTLELGREIVDDFVATCAARCRGQGTTLSVIDLAEFANTVPAKLSAFSKSISAMISGNEYKAVSNARYNTREFAASTKIDQVDLVHLAKNMKTAEGTALAKALQEAVKYNRTSSNMSNAYGVSIYFPYRKTAYVDKICSTYDQIGMDSDYAKCIRQFASLEYSGQAAAGGSYSTGYGSLFSQSPSSGSSGSADEIYALLEQLMGGGAGGFYADRALSEEDTAQYLAANYFDPSALVWDGDRISLPESQWELVHDLDLNMFYDDGEGYIDMGLDNVFEIDEAGNLIADTSRTWVSLNGQTVAYYRMNASYLDDSYSIYGRVPCFLNGERTNLIIVFDSENPDGYVAGAAAEYEEDVTLTVPKNMTELQDGDTIDFICDYYDYEGNFQKNYYLGEQLTVDGDLKVAYINVGDGPVSLMYRFTDIYNQEYWTEPLIR